MPLSNWADLKGYHRVPSNAEQVVCEDILADARAAIEAYIGYPILAQVRTYDVKPSCSPVYGNPLTVVPTPSYPFDFTDLTDDQGMWDNEGTEIPLQDLDIHGQLGFVRYADGSRFGAPWYRIRAAFGWSTHPEYELRIEQQIRRLILDTASDWFERRNPGIENQTSGGGVSTSFSVYEIPARVKMLAYEIKPPRLR